MGSANDMKGTLTIDTPHVWPTHTHTHTGTHTLSQYQLGGQSELDSYI